jgi:hypothetical protein
MCTKLISEAPVRTSHPGPGVKSTPWSRARVRRACPATPCGRWENAAAESKQISGLVTPRVFCWLLAAAQDVCVSA